MKRFSSARPIRHWLLMVIVTMTSVSGFIATDIFLPAVPALRAIYGISATQAQAMFSVYLYALAASQLLYGPVSDNVGRRTPMLFALMVYTLSSLAIPYTDDYGVLLMWRAIQGIGACGAIVVGRAVVGDIYSGNNLKQFFLSMSIVVGMSPAVAPAIGQQLYEEFGWQACFLLTGAFGVLLLLTVLFSLPETRRKENPSAHILGDAVKKYNVALRSPGFKRSVAIMCVSQSAYFAYLSESTFLLLSQGFPSRWLGYSYLSLSVSYVVGNVSARALSARLDSSKNLALGFSLFLFSGVVLGVGLFIRPDSALVMIVGMSVLTFANGFLLPLATAAAIGAVPAFPGSAAGLAGFCQLFCAALTAQAVGLVTDHQPKAFGGFILGLSVTNFALYIGERRATRSARSIVR